MRKNLFLLLCSVLMVNGCSFYHINSKDLSSEYLLPKDVSDVEYLPYVDQAYDLVGMVQVNAERNQKVSEVIEQMKAEAALLGGNAITNISSDATSEWKRLPAQVLVADGYIRANFRADVILVK